MSRVGLVSTFRFVAFPDDEEGHAGVERCWSVLSSFLLFHLAKGVDHVFLYADADDGENQVYVDKVAKEFSPSQVSVDVRNESQKQRQQAKCRVWEKLAPFSATEVPARQSLNAEDALWKAGGMALDWLLHLDIDELFFTAEPSIKPHFDRLSELGVEQMTYANHEAVPCQEHVKDYFREVDLFRINHLLLPFSSVVGECTRFWRRRTTHGQYMLAYDNGKAAVRVQPGRIVPQSVHRWTLMTLTSEDSEDDEDVTVKISCSAREGLRKEVAGGTSSCRSSSNGKSQHSEAKGTSLQGRTPSKPNKLVNRTAMVDPRELRVDEVLECEDPCVLHYPSCGLDWLKDKYRLLGGFPSSWFGGKLPIAPCFHLEARDAIQARFNAPTGERAGQDAAEDAARELYRREVMLCPDEHAEEIRHQLDHGVLRAFSGPAVVIPKALRVQRGASWEPLIPETATSTDVSPTASKGQGKRMVHDETDSTDTESAISSIAEGTSLDKNNVFLDRGSRGEADGNRPLAAGLDNSWILAACAREFL